MSKTTKKPVKRTVHLTRPAQGAAISMCGRSGEVEQTTAVAKVTCKSCRKAYDKDPKGYAAARRKLSKALKKG